MVTGKKGVGKATLKNASWTKVGLPKFAKMVYVKNDAEKDDVDVKAAAGASNVTATSMGNLLGTNVKLLKKCITLHLRIQNNIAPLKMDADISKFEPSKADRALHEKMQRGLERYLKNKVAATINSSKEQITDTGVTAGFSDSQINEWKVKIDKRVALIDAFYASSDEAEAESVALTDNPEQDEATSVLRGTITELLFGGNASAFEAAEKSGGVMIYNLYNDFQNNHQELLSIVKAVGGWDKLFEIDSLLS